MDRYVTDDSGTGVVHQAPGFGEVRTPLAHKQLTWEVLAVMSSCSIFRTIIECVSRMVCSRREIP